MTRQDQIATLWGNYCASAGLIGKIDQSTPGTYTLWLRKSNDKDWQKTHFGSFLYIKGYITGRLEAGIRL
jgi:hypothetical protein